MNRLIGVVLLAYVACVAATDNDYWAVGCFREERDAVRQAERISSAAGIEVWLLPVVNGEGKGYRLLVKTFEADEDRERLALQLRSVGVEEPEPFAFYGDTGQLRAVFSVVGAGTDDVVRTVPQPEPSHRETSGLSDNVSGYLVVAGSFADRAFADAQRQKLSLSFNDAGVISSDVDGKRLHRVVIGPVRDGRLDEVVESLMEEGIQRPWLLRYTGDALKAPDEPARGPLTPVRKPRRDSAPDPQPPPESGYNPARLRRDVSPFPEVP
ncbi:MAG: SPOR domain-containing protein [Pseudomonadales bacterium]|nr:SPOR domain-containing protein [Pseudomonadales bacterium]